jgi:hypothetical protein
MTAQTNPAERAVRIQRTAAQIIRTVLRLAQYAAGHPSEETRVDAEKRLNAAHEAMLGMDWSTVEQMATVYLVKTSAESGKDAAAVVAEDPRLAGHEKEIDAALAGCRDGDRIWPPMLALLQAAGLDGGISKSEHLKRKVRRYEAGGTPDVFQPPDPTP